MEGSRSHPYQEMVIAVWDAMRDVAPFAYRVIDEMAAYVADAAKLSVPWETAIDEQLLQKVLPKVKGTDPRIRASLSAFCEETRNDFPLSHSKATEMLSAFTAHGFVSFF